MHLFILFHSIVCIWLLLKLVDKTRWQFCNWRRRRRNLENWSLDGLQKPCPENDFHGMSLLLFNISKHIILYAANCALLRKFKVSYYMEWTVSRAYRKAFNSSTPIELSEGNKHKKPCRSQGATTWRPPGLSRGFVDYSKNRGHTDTHYTLKKHPE